MPGRARRRNSAKSTFRKRQWAIPDAAVVHTSAAWTLALAVAGRTPKLSRMAVEVMP